MWPIPRHSIPCLVPPSATPPALNHRNACPLAQAQPPHSAWKVRSDPQTGTRGLILDRQRKRSLEGGPFRSVYVEHAFRLAPFVPQLSNVSLLLSSPGLDSLDTDDFVVGVSEVRRRRTALLDKHFFYQGRGKSHFRRVFGHGVSVAFWYDPNNRFSDWRRWCPLICSSLRRTGACR